MAGVEAELDAQRITTPAGRPVAYAPAGLSDRAAQELHEIAEAAATEERLADERAECGATATTPDGTRLVCNSAPHGPELLHADGRWDGGQLMYDDAGRFPYFNAPKGEHPPGTHDEPEEEVWRALIDLGERLGALERTVNASAAVAVVEAVSTFQRRLEALREAVRAVGPDGDADRVVQVAGKFDKFLAGSSG